MDFARFNCVQSTRHDVSAAATNRDESNGVHSANRNKPGCREEAGGDKTDRVPETRCQEAHRIGTHRNSIDRRSSPVPDRF